MMDVADKYFLEAVLTVGLRTLETGQPGERVAEEYLAAIDLGTASHAGLVYCAAKAVSLVTESFAPDAAVRAFVEFADVCRLIARVTQPTEARGVQRTLRLLTAAFNIYRNVARGLAT